MRRPLTVAVIVVALVITASPSFASGPHRTARHHRSAPQSYLVWSLLGDYESNTESVRAPLVLARGGQVVPLTHPGVGQQDIEPRISPNGRWILFERDYPEGSDAWIVGLNGGGEHRLHLGCAAPCYGTKGGLNDRLRGPTPSWTRDGRHILYTRFSGPFKSNGDAGSANLWKYDLKTHRNTRFSSRRLHPTTEETLPDVRARRLPDRAARAQGRPHGDLSRTGQWHPPPPADTVVPGCGPSSRLTSAKRSEPQPHRLCDPWSPHPPGAGTRPTGRHDLRHVPISSPLHEEHQVPHAVEVAGERLHSGLGR